jgi:hypothetical protein
LQFLTQSSEINLQTLIRNSKGIKKTYILKN